MFKKIAYRVSWRAIQLRAFLPCVYINYWSFQKDDCPIPAITSSNILNSIDLHLPLCKLTHTCISRKNDRNGSLTWARFFAPPGIALTPLNVLFIGGGVGAPILEQTIADLCCNIPLDTEKKIIKITSTIVQICKPENIEHKSMKQVSYSGKYSFSTCRAHQSHLQFSFVVRDVFCPRFLHV